MKLKRKRENDLGVERTKNESDGRCKKRCDSNTASNIRARKEVVCLREKGCV